MAVRKRTSCGVLILWGAMSQIATGETLEGNTDVGLGWEGVATEAQVVGALSMRSPPRGVALSINRPKDEATLEISGSERISGLAIRCGVAGTVGPIVWQPPAGSATAPNHRILSGDIVAADANACGVPINNLASLEAAARERKLYAELQSDGVVIRTQLWPKLHLFQTPLFTGVAGNLWIDSPYWMSDQQVVGGSPETSWRRYPVSFALDGFLGSLRDYPGISPLAYFEYSVHRRAFQSLALYCGRAGEDGEMLAVLPDDLGVLSNFDLFPTQSSGACGMVVNNIASLVEALLRGNIYVAGALNESPSSVLRAQRLLTSTWKAVATPAQVVGGPNVSRPRLPVALSVNTASDKAQLHVQSFHVGLIDDLTIRCAIAGTDGPVVWRAPLGSALANPFHNGEIIAADPAGPCGVRINNLASLAAAAQERRLYVELHTEGVLIRGQLWPTMDPKPIAWLSDQQVVGAGSTPPRWERSWIALSFTEDDTANLLSETRPPSGGLYSFQQYTPFPGQFQSLTLYCGRAGENGEILMALAPEGLADWDKGALFPTHPAGPCGMAVTNTASLLEAVLRGNVYVVGVLNDSTQLRGQFLPPTFDLYGR